MKMLVPAWESVTKKKSIASQKPAYQKISKVQLLMTTYRENQKFENSKTRCSAKIYLNEFITFDNGEDDDFHCSGENNEDD